ARTLDAAEAAGERLDERRDLRRDPGRYLVEVDGGDPLRDDDPVGIRAGEEHQLEALLSACTARAGAARRAVRCDNAAAVDDAAELVAEPGGQLTGEQRMAPSERLQVGGIGERKLHLHEHLPRARLRPGDLLDPQVAWAVQQRRLHGAN